MSGLEGQLDAFEQLDWSNAALFGPPIEPVLTQWSRDKTFLRTQLRAVAAGYCLDRCERRPGIDKIVLGESRSGQVRLRMHVYRGGRGEGGSIPHDHRWSFTSVILSGSLRHAVYMPAADQELPRIQFFQHQPAGTVYSLQADAIHSAHPQAPTVTLFVRGPGTKRKATFVNPKTGGQAHRVGEEEEAALAGGRDDAIIAWSKMIPSDVAALEPELASLGII